jgi:K+-transporting ATPase KdpF subunit
MDIVWLGTVGVFFLLTWGFVLLAGKLSGGGREMTALLWIGGIISAGLLVYLFAALLKPEWFQ